MERKRIEDLLKISELAKAANVSVYTAKFYVSQGFIQPAVKTSANMAYYDPSCIDRIRTIKKLQKEWFLPLDVIKNILKEDQSDESINLIGAIYKPALGTVEAVPVHGAVKVTGLSRKQLNALIEAKVVNVTERGGRRVFDARNLEILQLVKQRCDAGLPFEHTLESFSLYTRAMRSAAREDVDMTIRKVILPSQHSAQKITNLIRLADSTLDTFLAKKREQLDSQYSSRVIAELTGYCANLERLLHGAQGDMDGEPTPLWLEVRGQIVRLLEANRPLDITTGGAAFLAAGDYFWTLRPAREADPEWRKRLAALRYGFFALAPDVLDWSERARTIGDTFAADQADYLSPEEAGAFAGDVADRLDRIRADRAREAGLAAAGLDEV